MTSYSKGRAFEYRVRRHLEGKGWVVFRTAGSHSPADLIALRTGEVWLVQCKATSGYMTPVERQKFTTLANELGVMAVAVCKAGKKLVYCQLIDSLASGTNKVERKSIGLHDQYTG
jgi:Holliday junction resolvase